MLRSKSSRGGFADFEKKSNESVLSRTSSPRSYRGDNLGKSTDWNAHKSFEKRRSLDSKPSKVSDLTENQSQRPLSMQEHMGKLQEELKRAKDLIFVVEEERKRAVDDMKEAKRIAHKANMKVNDSLSPKNVGEQIAEIKNLKEELARKDDILEALRKELDQARKLEVKLDESNPLLSRSEEELSKAKASETLLMNELSDTKKKFEELHDEVETRKVSEIKMLESLQNQTEQLQQANLEAKKSKLKIASLNDRIVSLEASLKQNDKVISVTYTNKFIPCAPGEMKMFSELDEVESLRNEVILALQAEAKSERAMDDLALVLKEVATESNEAKEKVRVTESALEYSKAEVEQLKQMIRSSEEKYKKLLEDAKREAEAYKNNADKLNLEAEESHFAWTAKEVGFISCIKRTEEERDVALYENNRLMESLKEAEHSAREARDDCCKLRNILKQAVNEANAAKSAASIARDENSNLKDSLAEMEEAMHFLALKNERLRISDTAASENIKSENKDGTLKSSVIAVSSDEQEKKMWKNIIYDIEVFDSEASLFDSEDSDQTIQLKGSLFDSDASP